MENENVIILNEEAITEVIEDTMKGIQNKKKLKTSTDKYNRLVANAKIQIDSREKVEIVELEPVLESANEDAEEVVELKPIEIEEMPKVVELPKSEIKEEPITVEISEEESEEQEQPVYSFEQESRPKMPVYESQLKPMVSNGLLNIKSTEDLRRDFERAEGPIEKQTISEIIKESESEDLKKQEKEAELQEILRQEEEIKKAKDLKQKEVKECVENRKRSSQEWAQTIAGAKKVDLYDRTLQVEEAKGLAELEAKKAQLKEKKERLMAERKKVVDDYNLNLIPEEEQKPVKIEENKSTDLDLSSFYETLSGFEKDIKDIKDPVSFKEAESPIIR